MNNEETNALSEKLDRFQAVKRFDSESERESVTLARSFQEISESFTKIYKDLLPKISEANTDAEIIDILGDIGEEYRHILYHIKDGRYFEYLP